MSTAVENAAPVDDDDNDKGKLFAQLFYNYFMFN